MDFFTTSSLDDSPPVSLAPVHWQVFKNHWLIQLKYIAGACLCHSIKGDTVVKYVPFSTLKQMHLGLLLSHVTQLILSVQYSLYKYVWPLCAASGFVFTSYEVNFSITQEFYTEIILNQVFLCYISHFSCHSLKYVLLQHPTDLWF